MAAARSVVAKGKNVSKWALDLTSRCVKGINNWRNYKYRNQAMFYCCFKLKEYQFLTLL